MNRPDLGRFLRFASVGVVGAVVHMTAFEAIRMVTHFGQAAGWLSSFALAATAAWALNRRFTFRASAAHATPREWLRYLLVAGAGATVHFAVFCACIAWIAIFRDYPAFAIVPGSLASLCVTYLGAAIFVFPKASRSP